MYSTSNVTEEFYLELQTAYDWYNSKLFNNTLGNCIITINREKKTKGYYSCSRFLKRKEDNIKVDEISLNPEYFAIQSVKVTLSTLVHEMVHKWQFDHGAPGRSRYHNKQWAAKMESIGLIPTDTGVEGGKKTGDCMTHYIIAGGKFDTVTNDLLNTHFDLTWADRYMPRDFYKPTNSGFGTASISPIESIDSVSPSIEVKPHKQTRLKYVCPNCGIAVWGGRDLKLLCEDCSLRLEVVE